MFCVCSSIVWGESSGHEICQYLFFTNHLRCFYTLCAFSWLQICIILKLYNLIPYSKHTILIFDSACKAYRRIILSGTPVQNDLDELYAVVSFVAPGYLGECFCIPTIIICNLQNCWIVLFELTFSAGAIIDRFSGFY